MRYFVQRDDDPDSPTYEQPMALHRFEVRESSMVADRFDRKLGRWIIWPETVLFTGLGGDNQYVEIDQAQAMEILLAWGNADADALLQGQAVPKSSPKTPQGASQGQGERVPAPAQAKERSKPRRPKGRQKGRRR